jgi:hypothetical protein
MATNENAQSARGPTDTDPYCGNCGYSFRGLTDTARCPECGEPVVKVLMRPGFGRNQGRRYRSEAKLFGLPVVDVALGPYGTQRIGKARGIIAVGDVAVGWLAIGGVAIGIVALGGVGIGIFAVGGFAMGLLTAFGGLAASGGIATGGLALAMIAFGGVAVGYAAQGGLAAGVIARGGQTFGNRVPGKITRFDWVLGKFPPTGLDALRPLAFTLLPAVAIAALTCMLAIVALRRHDETGQRAD